MNPMGPGEALLQMGFCTVWIANPPRLWDPVARPRFYNMCICEKGLSSLHSIFTFGKNFIKFLSISHSEILLSRWRERGSVCWCQAMEHLLIFFSQIVFDHLTWEVNVPAFPAAFPVNPTTHWKNRAGNASVDFREGKRMLSGILTAREKNSGSCKPGTYVSFLFFSFCLRVEQVRREKALTR